MLRIHCFQHVHYEDLGCITQWCEMNNHLVTYTRFYEENSIPEIDNYDWLIVMGGPMGIYDEEEFHWLKAEKQAIKLAIDAEKTVLGICLGSQLIADVLGANVFPNHEKEIGWFDIRLTPSGQSAPLFTKLGTQLKVFHWHGDTFNLPEGAIHLAESTACKNQAYLFNEKVLGLQFHFEVTMQSLELMLLNGKNELVQAQFIQNEHEILGNTGFIQENNNRMFNILDFLAQ